MKRAVSVDDMNATLDSKSSANKVRVLEKQSVFLSVVKRDCNLQNYGIRNKGTEDKKPRRCKKKTDSLFGLSDFDLTTPQQEKSEVAEVAAAAAWLLPSSTSTKPAALQNPKEGRHILPKANWCSRGCHRYGSTSSCSSLFI
jgi:hypothetical protein